MQPRPKSVLVWEVRKALGLSREELGVRLGLSKRTVGRYEGDRTTAVPSTMMDLARLVHAVNPALAAECALSAGVTLEMLGLEPPSGAPSTALLADSVVCAAADAIQVIPGTVRLAVHAAFRRARELRMTVADVENAMIEALGIGKAKKAAKEG
jgi:transcriptional regulator with XRE-family HTH domain